MGERSERPRLVFDDDCGFCTWWVEYVAARGSFDVVGFSALSAEDRASLPDDWERCAHLLTDDGVYSCGAAVEEAAVRLETPSRYPAVAFRLLPQRERPREWLYRLAADNRDVLGKVVRREPPARAES